MPKDQCECGVCGGGIDSPDATCPHCLLDLGFSTISGSNEEAGSNGPGLETNQRFGDYDLVEEIARGGMGIVYRAVQRGLERTVALKLILGGKLATRELVQRFRGEAATAGALRHPNIVSVHEVGLQDGNHFFSMDYVDGLDLGQLTKERSISTKEAAEYMYQIAGAVHYAHEKGILHRDLKPSNILIETASNQPRITDFGLAKRLDVQSDLTCTGQMLGSPPFMAPEQADPRRGMLGRTGDVYALGGVLYFMLTGRAPFQGDSLEVILRQVFDEEPVAPRLLNPNVPPDLETLCLKCLSKEPQRRYLTSEKLAEDLGRFLKGVPILARPTGVIERGWRWCRRKPVLTSLLLVTLSLLLALAIGSPIALYRIQQARFAAESHLYSADLNVAQIALEEGDILQALPLLNRHRPIDGAVDLRGFEWRYLWRLAQGNQAMVFDPKVMWPMHVVTSPDGRLMAAGGIEGNPSIVWSLASYRVVQELPRGDRPICFTPQSDRLVTVGANGLKVWDTKTWIAERLGDGDEKASGRLHPDGRTLVIYGQGLEVWDLETQSLLKTKPFGSNNFFAANTLSISSDGKLLSCSRGLPYSSHAELQLFYFPSLDPVEWSERFPADIVAVVFHPSENFVVTGGWSGNIRIWNTVTGEEVLSSMKHESRVKAMVFSPTDSNILATAGGDRSVRIWDFSLQQEMIRLQGPEFGLDEIAWTPDGRSVVAGGNENPVVLWNLSEVQPDVISVPTESRNHLLGYSSDQQHLVTVDANGRVMFRDAKSLDEVKMGPQIKLRSGYVAPPDVGFMDRSVDFTLAPLDVNASLTKLGFGRSDGWVEIWDLRSQEQLDVQVHESRIRGLAFHPEKEQCFVTVSEESDVALWDLSQSVQPVASNRVEKQVALDWPVCVAFSPAREQVAVGILDELVVLGAEDLIFLKKCPIRGRLMSVRFSPDGAYLVAAYAGKIVGVWETEHWTERPLYGHDLMPYDIAFSPDGRRVVTGSDKLVIWDTTTWQQLAIFSLPIQDITRVLFSPDGNDLVVSDASGFHIWRAASHQDIEERASALR